MVCRIKIHKKIYVALFIEAVGKYGPKHGQGFHPMFQAKIPNLFYV